MLLVIADAIVFAVIFCESLSRSTKIGVAPTLIIEETDAKKVREYLLRLRAPEVGEEQEASKIVNNIVRERKIKKIKLVSQLVDIIKKSKKKKL